MSYSPLSQLKATLDDIREWVSRLGFLAEMRATTGRLQVDTVGTVTASIASAQTLATVTTVGTLTNQSQVGGLQAQNQIPALMNLEATIGNIDNIIVS